MSKKPNLSFWIYDIPLVNVPIEERHRSVVDAMRRLTSPFTWRGLELPATPIRKKGAFSAFYAFRYSSISVQYRGWYHIRDAKYLYDKAECDDIFSFEFKLGIPELEYASLVHQHFPNLIAAIGGYRACLPYGHYAIPYGDLHKEERVRLRDDEAIDTDGRNNIFALDPVHFWNEELCQKALGYGRDEVIHRLTGKVPLVRSLMDGVYVVFSDNPDLTFEEYCAYNDALKPMLGLI